MAVSALRRWVGVGALVAVVGAGLYMYWGRLFPEKITEISRRTDLPELSAAKVAPSDWPWWRGPTGDNHSPDTAALTAWKDSDIAWKKAIPGRGHSTPILVGNKVILTTADEGAGQQMVLALDRSSGELLWQKTVHEGGLMSKHGVNTHASGTPASDGERIFAQFLNSDAQRLTALDLDGKILWQTEVGKHKGAGSFGSGPSPALAGSLVIVNGDSPEAGFIAAVHRQTGDVVWRKARPASGPGSYGSPLAAELGGKPQVLLSGLDKVRAYDPASGDVLWECDGLSTVSANTPVFADGLVVGSTGAGDAMIAAKPDGIRAWQTTKSSDVPYATTPLYHDGHLYLVSRAGQVLCLDAKTGKQRWGDRARGEFWSSPLKVGKYLYVGSREGEVLVFEANPEEFVEVARNKMDAGIYASPIAAGGKLFIRTEQSLYCIGK